MQSRNDTLNIDFFNQWSSDMAYILGFTTADGSVKNSKTGYCLRYELATKDRVILEFIAKTLYGHQNKVYDKQRFRLNKFLSSSVIEIYCKEIVKSLEKFYIIPNKTGKEKLPNIPELYKADYLRGLFDGDGCINWTGKKNKIKYTRRLTIASASKDFLENVKVNLGFNYGNISWNGACYIWKVSKKEHLDNIYNFMYQNDSFFLARKKDKFLCQNL